MVDWLIALLCFIGALSQFGTIRFAALPLVRASKRVLAVGLLLGAVKYVFAAVAHWRVAITGIPITLIAIAAIMEAWAQVFDYNQFPGPDRRSKC